MSVNGALTIFSFASWVSYVLIGFRHPFIRYWQHLLAKTTATCSLRHPANEHQRSVNSFMTCIFCNHSIAWIFVYLNVLLTAFLGKNTIYWRWHRYQINRYCKLLNEQKHIICCWKRDSDNVLLTHFKYKSLIWICWWTRWATHWQPTQFRWVGRLPWNRIRVGSSGVLTIRTGNVATVRFGTGPRPEVTVRNSC
jgi:hypothetical protein